MRKCCGGDCCDGDIASDGEPCRYLIFEKEASAALVIIGLGFGGRRGVVFGYWDSSVSVSLV